MVDMMSDAPEGYEPVVCTACDGTAFFIERTDDPVAQFGPARKLWPDGSPVVIGDMVHCGTCQRTPQRFTRDGVRRDEHGVRRLWCLPHS